jgi:NodT family efflux transporter outer membrane factor (OMF) lipoprotein
MGLALTLTLAACTVGPNYHRPSADVESAYSSLRAPTTQPATQPSVATTGGVITEWWHSFNDPELDHLITEAIAENYDLRIAAARIRQARSQRNITAADIYPEVDADAGYDHARGSKNVQFSLGGSSGQGGGNGGGSSSGSGGGNSSAGAQSVKPLVEHAGGSSSSGSGQSTDRGSSPFSNTLNPIGAGGLPGETTDLYQVGFDAHWEIDVFGGTRRQVEAATADLQAAVESRRDMMVTLLAEVARNYVELRGTQRRLAVARQNLAAGQDLLELTRSIRQSGLTTQLDVARAAGQTASTAAMIPPLEGQVRRSMHALAILVARNPDALDAELDAMKPLAPLPPIVPVGLPSDLLRRRPDIRRAERQIAAANARIGSATADLFPKFGLTGSVGLDATQFKNLFDWQSRYFLISPTITWPIFDAGRIVNNIALQKGNTDEAALVYKKTVLTALREVEDSLVNYATEQGRHQALVQVLQQNHDALDIARSQYTHGLVDFLNVLDAERSVFSAEDDLVQSDVTLSTNLVAVYKALGGGWEVERTHSTAAH